MTTPTAPAINRRAESGLVNATRDWPSEPASMRRWTVPSPHETGWLVPTNTRGIPAAFAPSSSGSICAGPHHSFAVESPKAAPPTSARTVLCPGSRRAYTPSPNRCGASTSIGSIASANGARAPVALGMSGNAAFCATNAIGWSRAESQRH